MLKSRTSILGRKVGSAKVVSVAEVFSTPKGGLAYKYNLLCACGHSFVLSRAALYLPGEHCPNCYKKSKVPSLSNHPIFKIWESMVRRCYSPSHSMYHLYGGRGVTICPEWLGGSAGKKTSVEGFSTFLSYIGERPSPRHTIDRVDNSRGYEPGNVRWATFAEQAKNRRSTVLVSMGGETYPFATLLRKLNVNSGHAYKTMKAKSISHQEFIDGILATHKESL